MCIAHRAHMYIGSSLPKVEDISGGGGGVWSSHRKWASTTQLCLEQARRDIYALSLPPVHPLTPLSARDDSSRAAK